MTAIHNTDDDAGLAAAAGRDADVFDFLRRDNEDENSAPVIQKTPAAALQSIHERARGLKSEGLDIEDLPPDVSARHAREDHADFTQLGATERAEAARLIANNFRNRTYSTEFARQDPQAAQEVLKDIGHRSSEVASQAPTNSPATATQQEDFFSMGNAARSPADSRPKRPSRSEAMYRKFDKAIQDGQMQSAMEIALRPEFSANQSIDGVPVLSMALRAGDSPLVEALIARGADVNAPDQEGLAPIHYARSTGDVDRLQEAGASIDTTQPLPAVVAEALGQQEASRLRESIPFQRMEEKRKAEFGEVRAMLDQKAQEALSIGVIQDTQQQHHVTVERNDDMRSYSRWPTRSAALTDESNLRHNIEKFGESVANFLHLPKITKRPAPDNSIRYEAEPLATEQPATASPNVGNEIADNRLPLPAIASRVLKTHELPENFQKKFIVSDAVPGQFFHHDQNRKLAFADKGAKLVTDDHRPEVIGSMIELAKAKGWSTLSLKGSEEFKREAWMQASLEGIEVNGFKPKPEDVAVLDQLRNARMGNSLYKAGDTPLPTLTNEMRGGTTRTKPEAERLSVPEDYKPSSSAIAAGEKMRAHGVPESKLRLAMYGVDMNNRIAAQLGLQPFQARIFDAAAKQQPQGKAVSIAVEKQQPQAPATDIAQPSPSIRR